MELHQEWRNLERSAVRGGETHDSHEKAFVANFDNLFDIAPDNVLVKIKHQEDRDFLLMQRMEGRQGSMIGVDENTFAAQKRQAELETQEETRRKRSKQEEVLRASIDHCVCSLFMLDINELCNF